LAPAAHKALKVSGGGHSHLTMLEYKAGGIAQTAFWPARLRDVWRRTEGVYENRHV